MRDELMTKIGVIVAVFAICWGVIEYHMNSNLQIYLARKQIYNPIYQQLDLSLREFYGSVGLFFGNKGESPNPYECIVKANILSTSLYQIKHMDKDLCKQVEDFMLHWVAIPTQIWQYKTYPKEWQNPNISDKEYLEYNRKIEAEFLLLREKIAGRIQIKE